MFIRKRISKNKRGFTESYQLIETYREEGKVKQRIVCNLGRDATPEAALETAHQWMSKYEEWLSRREQRRHPYSGRLRSEKELEEGRQRLEKGCLKWKNRIEQLEGVVSQMCNRNNISDTTVDKKA